MDKQILAFFIITFIAASAMAGLSAYAWKCRTVIGAAAFSLQLLSLAVWLGAVLFGMLAQTESGAFVWAVIRMAGVFAVPVFWVIFALQYSGMGRILTPLRMILLGLIPAISFLLMATNEMHHLFLQDIIYERHGSFLIDVTWVLGPWFAVHVSYAYALVLAGLFLFIRASSRLENRLGRQSLMMIIGAVIPLVTNIAYVFHLIPGVFVNYDPFGFVISGIIFARGFFRYKLFDIVPIARRLLVDNMNEGLIVLDLKRRIVDVNPQACSIFNLQSNGVIGKDIEDAVPDIYSWCEDVDTDSARECFQIGDRFYELRITNIFAGRKNIGNMLLFQDITLQKNMEAQLLQLAQNDPLTGIYNRRFFMEQAEKEIVRARRYNRDLSILMIDCDHFKKINDRFGHSTGDRVLKLLTEECLRHIRETDIISRYGGEEFIVASQESSHKEAKYLAERLKSAVAGMQINNGDDVITITISIGIATFSNSLNKEETLQSVIERADKALYRAKAGGRNRVED